MKKFFTFTLSIFLFFSCTQKSEENKVIISEKETTKEEVLKNAYFAGGCFWCMEGTFEAQPGVKEAIAGYIGGKEETATYKQVSTGLTKHREGVMIVYNPEIISFAKLVELFWIQIDPLDPDGQFADKGYHYTTAIFYSDEDEKLVIEKSKQALSDSKKFDKPIATKIIKVAPFYNAEEEHQDYYKKSSLRYKAYEKGSGRKDFKEDTWKEEKKALEEISLLQREYPKGEGLRKVLAEEESKEQLKERLTDIQYNVTQNDATEKPFDNPYWDNKKEGIYVDIVDGKPLYSSLDKYKSGTGWPSFTKPIKKENVVEKEDNTLFSKRTEIEGATSGAHIGHVFSDGPSEKGGLRYCMNSASLKFIPKEDLEKEGYKEFIEMFK